MLMFEYFSYFSLISRHFRTASKSAHTCVQTYEMSAHKVSTTKCNQDLLWFSFVAYIAEFLSVHIQNSNNNNSTFQESIGSPTNRKITVSSDFECCSNRVNDDFNCFNSINKIENVSYWANRLWPLEHLYRFNVN